MPLVSLPEAQKLLGLTSRMTLYRKARNGELPTVTSANGQPLVETDGLAELWGRIVQRQSAKVTTRATQPPAPLDPAPAPLNPPPVVVSAAVLAPAAIEPEPVAPAPKTRRRAPVVVTEDPLVGSDESDFDENGVPVYNVQRSWVEYEKRKHEEKKRLKTTLELMELERQLYRAETVEQAWGRAVNMTRTKILGVPSRAKQQIPHLTPDEIELLRDLLREALEELAAGEVMA